MPIIEIDHDKCDASDCAECVDSCPMSIFQLENSKITIKSVEDCNLCEMCRDLCPSSAIRMTE